MGTHISARGPVDDFLYGAHLYPITTVGDRTLWDIWDIPLTTFLGSEQALAPVREPDTFEGEAEHEKITIKGSICAANIHRQEEGGLFRTYYFLHFRVLLCPQIPFKN